MLETVYFIGNQKTMECYCGRTYQSVGERWTQHIRAAWTTKVEKKLAEALRHAPDDFEFLVLEQSETASEARWMEQLKGDGWALLNETGGNRSKPKRRDTAKERAWRALNALANGELNAKRIEMPVLPVEVHEPVKSTKPAWNETPEYLAKAKALQEEWLAQQARWADLREQLRKQQGRP